MKIKIIKAGPWQIGGNIKTFSVDQVLEVGADVPDKIAYDMLRCDYAEPVSGQPKIETKSSKAYSHDMGKKKLELWARENLDIELDRRKSSEDLHEEVVNAIKERDNE